MIEEIAKPMAKAMATKIKLSSVAHHGQPTFLVKGTILHEHLPQPKVRVDTLTYNLRQMMRRETVGNRISSAIATF